MRIPATLHLGLAVFQALSTVLGVVTLLFTPQAYEFMLRDTIFAGQYVLAALLLGGIVGGAQWAAVALHVRRSDWWLLGHCAAGVVMVGWIVGECLVLDSFIWPHAVWGGLGLTQILGGHPRARRPGTASPSGHIEAERCALRPVGTPQCEPKGLNLRRGRGGGAGRGCRDLGDTLPSPVAAKCHQDK